MASILNTGVSGLTAFQRQLGTTAHNISNAGTEGYSRQEVLFAARPGEAFGFGFIGSGVETEAVRRVFDQYQIGRVRAFTASSEEFDIYAARAAQVDNILADPDAGLDGNLQDFFNALQDVANDPTSVPARQVLLQRANLLSERFGTLDTWFEDLRAQVNVDMGNLITEINGLATSIGSVNARILEVSNNNGGTAPNDLLDERDRLITELSRYTTVTTNTQTDGATNVFIGSGQALVVGTAVNSLAVTVDPQAADAREISITQSGGVVATITEQMSGGRLGGLLRFRDEVLDPAHNSLGLVAVGLGTHFNAEHQTGMDLDGDLGADFFSVAAPEALADPGNSGTITLDYDDVSNLTNYEYDLGFDGATWNLIRRDTGTVIAMTGAGTVASPFVADGMSIVVNAGAAAGDSYRLRPTRAGASGIDVQVADARDIAAAEVVRTSDGTANSGTASIGAGAQVTRTGATKLAAPVTLTFDAALNQFNISTGGTLAYDPATDSGNTLTLTLAGLGDYSFTMTGTPADGDTFALSDNTAGVGDNRNALRLDALRSQSLLMGSNATFAETYGIMIADVGTRTSQAQTNGVVQNELRTQAVEAHEETSGVNLDEEAANLVRFQHAYQAAAQVIATAGTVFDTLIGAVRG